MTVLVTLMVYSGRQNPSWELSSKQIREVAKYLKRAKRVAAIKHPGRLGRLGYSGFAIRSFNGELKPDLFVGDGLADHGPTSPTIILDGPALETYLLDTAGRVVDDRTRTYVREHLSKVSYVAKREKEVAVALFEPPFDPGKWNDDPSVCQSNNCYNYANDKITNTMAQPGKGSGQEGPYPPACGGTAAASERDGLVLLDSPNITPAQGQVVALVISNSLPDFHWYRRDSNGYWSHKPGSTPARDTDDSGVRIQDPETCNRGPYDQFCRYYNAIPSQTTIL